MSARRKLKRAVGVVQLLGWILFGAACAGQKPSPESSIRAVLDIIEMVCPPETTVGDCAQRVKAWLPAERNPYVAPPSDAGTD